MRRLLGTDASNILIPTTIKVNPVFEKRLPLRIREGVGRMRRRSFSRVDRAGKMTELALENAVSSVARLPNAPVSNVKAGFRNPRLETITQLAYEDGSVIVAGLSNEEFSSNLRVIPFPFRAVNNGASVEIYHGSHGDYETQAPVRTFLPWKIGSERYIVAAYTCTPRWCSQLG